jgi:hypothetical protein
MSEILPEFGRFFYGPTKPTASEQGATTNQLQFYVSLASLLHF